jgi:Protein of unknown function (DUF3047)
MRFVKVFSGLIALAGIAHAQSLTAFSDSSGKINAAWEPFSFAKVETKTEYAVVQDPQRGAVIHATAIRGASALRQKFEKLADQVSTLKWSWKIGEIPTGSSPNQKETDDYAARIYVAFAYDPTKVNTLTRAQFGFVRAIYGDYPPLAAISYIVDPMLPIGTVVDNPFTNRVKMIVVDNGQQKGVWQSFERNIYDDYKKAFGVSPPTAIAGVIIMTDADNTGTRAEAWYGNLSLNAK